MASVGIRTFAPWLAAEREIRATTGGPKAGSSASLAVVMTVGRRALPTALVTAGLLILCASVPALLAAQSTDQPVQLGSSGQSLGDLTGENSFPLQITGFGVADYSYDQTSGANSARAGKMAVAFFREMSEKVWFFGQLTTSLSEEGGDAGGDIPTEIEIDNLIVNYTPGGASGLSFSFGKFDVPVGFERDDEPLNFQASSSFNFEMARPAKMVGLVGRWAVTPSVDVTGMVGNGWDAQVDPNKEKTGGLRLGFTPTEHASFGVSGLLGGEGDPGAVHQRYLVSLDYALEPGDWIVAGEANWGGEHDALGPGAGATWNGATLTLFRRLGEHFGTTLRGETFHDPNGVRSGDAQTLRSLTFSPIWFVGSGQEGIFANIEHTTFRIPRFQLRAEARLDHSSEPLLGTESDPGHWRMRYTLQLVTTF
jgi:hypothetical protein